PQFIPGRETLAQFGAGEGKSLGRDIMEPPAGPARAAPEIPSRQEIEARPEPKLGDTKKLLVPPRLREIVAAQEDMAAFRQSALAAVINIPESPGDGRMTALPPKIGRRQRSPPVCFTRGHEGPALRPGSKK